MVNAQEGESRPNLPVEFVRLRRPDEDTSPADVSRVDGHERLKRPMVNLDLDFDVNRGPCLVIPLTSLVRPPQVA